MNGKTASIGLQVLSGLHIDAEESLLRKKPFLNCKRYTNFRKLKEGFFGAVYLAEDKRGHEVAIKMLTDNNKKRNQKALKSEANLLKSLNHPGIIKLLHVHVSRSACFFSMELARGVDLHHRFQTNKASEQCARHIFKQVVAALCYLHNKKRVTHHDVKPKNILLMSMNHFPVAKLCDFGLSRTCSKTTDKGTTMYMAPEKLRLWRNGKGKDPPCNEKVDVYALGVSLLQVGTHVEFVSTVGDALQFYNRILRGDIEREVIPQVTRQKSPEFVDFFSRCVQDNHERRACASELSRHPWLHVEDCGNDCADKAIADETRLHEISRTTKHKHIFSGLFCHR